MSFILPGLAIACTVLVTLAALAFCMAMSANAKPAQIRALKLWMIGISAMAIAGIAVGVLLGSAGESGWAALAAFGPTVILGVMLLVALIKPPP